jgi:YVTN family beta-propeller protein
MSTNAGDRHLVISVEESDSTIGFYDSSTYEEVGRVEVGFWPHEIELSADGRTAYVTNFGVKDYDEQIGRPGSSISVIDIPNRCEVRRLYTFKEPFEYAARRAPHGIKLSPDGTKLFVNVEKDPRMLVFDISDPQKNTPMCSFALSNMNGESGNEIEPSSEYPLPEGTHNFLFDTVASRMYVVSGRSGLSAINPDTGEVLYQKQFMSSEGGVIPVRGLAYTPDKKWLIASLRNEIRLLEATDKGFKDIRTLNNGGAGFGVGQLLYSEPAKPDAKGNYDILAPAVWESQVVFVDATTGNVTGRTQVGLDPIHIAYSPNGSLAYVSHGRSYFISVIDVVRRKVIGRIPTKGGPNGIAVTHFSPKPQRAKLVFGACLPLSGPFGTEGREIRIGYEYWRERVNAAGGILVDSKPHVVELVYRDIGAFPPNSPEIPKLAEELIKDENAQFMLGTYPSPAHVEYAKVAEKSKIPLVIATGAGTDIYDPSFKYVFGIMSPARLYLAGTIEVVRMSIPKDNPKLAFMSCRDFAAIEDAKATIRYAVKKGFAVVQLTTPPDLPTGFVIEKVDAETPDGKKIQVEILTFPDGHKAFDSVLSRMAKELDLDLCLATGHLGESVAIVSQSAKVHFHPRGFGLSVGPSLASFRGQLTGQGVSPEYLFGAAQWTDRVPVVGQDPFVTPSEFARLFFERYSMKASYFSAGGVACGLVLLEAMRRSGTADGTKIAEELRSLDIETFFARIRFDERGMNSSKPMYTIQLRANGNEFDEVILWPPLGTIWPRPEQ